MSDYVISCRHSLTAYLLFAYFFHSFLVFSLITGSVCPKSKKKYYYNFVIALLRADIDFIHIYIANGHAARLSSYISEVIMCHLRV